MYCAALFLDTDECLELVPTDLGWARYQVDPDVHPEDAFVASVLRALRESGPTSELLAHFARCAAQGVLDELGLDADVTRADVAGVMGRSLTLSLQRRVSLSGRSRVVRALMAALRRDEQVTTWHREPRAAADEAVGLCGAGGRAAAA